MSLSLVGRTSWSAADVLVGLLDCVANRASRTGTSGAAQESRPTFRAELRPWLFTTAVIVLGSSLGCGHADRTRTIPPAVTDELYVRAGGSEPPAGKLSNPFTRNAQAAKDGEKLFSTMNCDGCHGGGALGWVGPSLVDGRWRYGGSDGEVYHSVFYGRPRGMPAYGGMLPSDAIWTIVTYLRAQPIPASVPTESWIEDVPARPAPVRGEESGNK